MTPRRGDSRTLALARTHAACVSVCVCTPHARARRGDADLAQQHHKPSLATHPPAHMHTRECVCVREGVESWCHYGDAAPRDRGRPTLLHRQRGGSPTHLNVGPPGLATCTQTVCVCGAWQRVQVPSRMHRRVCLVGVHCPFKPKTQSIWGSETLSFAILGS